MTDTNEEQIAQLSQIEQSLHQFLRQRQSFSAQLNEVETALKELEKTDNSYKIIGNIMVLKDKEELKVDLSAQKEMIELRIKTIESQEEKLKEKAKKLQQEIVSKMNSKE